MVKNKLRAQRKSKNISQEDMAFALSMEQSQYSRRENGTIRISEEEWEQFAKILEVPVEDIYEGENAVYVITNENASGNYSGSVNNFSSDRMIIDTLNRYILKLETENNLLKEENEKLKVDSSI